MKKQILAAIALSTAPLVSAEVTGPITLSIDKSSPSEVLAWSWGASQSGSFHSGGGGGSGKANVQDISLTRYLDDQSVTFLMRLVEGQVINTAVIARENLTIRLQDVIVTSYSVGGSGSTSKKQEPQTENITLNFRKVTTEIDGAAYCYDVSANVSC